MTNEKNIPSYVRTMELFNGFGVIEKNPYYKPDPRYNEFTGELIEEEGTPLYYRSKGKPNGGDMKKIMANNRADKKKRDQLQKTAEKIQKAHDYTGMIRLVERNNAAQKHLLTFVTMANYAVTNSRGIALAYFKKRLSRDKIKREWDRVREFISNHQQHGNFACSIGLKENGWLTLRTIAVTSEGEESTYKMTAPLYQWLLKRQWLDEATASNKQPGYLLDHYLLKPVDKQEVFEVYAPEMFEVARTQLAMPKSTRTYRTTGASDIVNSHWRITEESQGSYSVRKSGRSFVEGITINGKGVVTDCYDLWNDGNTVDEEGDF